MTTALWVIAFLTVCAGCLCLGFGLGVRHAARKVEADAERMRRILDEPNHGGMPHNFNAEPARVSQGRIRGRRTFNLQGYKREGK